ncbi:ABC transporter, partial [Thalassiosira pseudonana CCMP1335]
LFGTLVVLAVISSGISVYFSYLVRDFYSALTEKRIHDFWRVMIQFVVSMVVFVPIDVMYQFVRVKLQISWRKWLTERVMSLYFRNKVYYALERKSEVDNPDQRMAEDIKSFTEFSLSFFLLVIDTSLDLAAFSVILTLIMPELFIALFVFAILGTLFTVLIGKKLIPLNFEALQREADFRFSLVRVRENAESIAFYGGEDVETKETGKRFLRVIQNMGWINVAERNLNCFTITYNRLTWILPIIVVAPSYFAGIIEFGVVQQARTAFDHILYDMSIIVTQFSNVAQFSAGIERLFSFLTVIQELDPERSVRSTTQNIITIRDLQLATPDNRRVLVQDLEVSLTSGKNMLITGNSGAGKSSLLRAIAGLWSTGSGEIERPRKQYVYFLPQRPYCPPGTLRDQLLYPSTEEENGYSLAGMSASECRQYGNEDLLNVLNLVQLPNLASRAGDGDPRRGLDSVLDWTNTLSLGEQQRLAFARIVLNRPRLVIMDESTSALDVEAEGSMYNLLRGVQTDGGGGLTYISVGHRPTLLAYHDVKLT